MPSIDSLPLHILMDVFKYVKLHFPPTYIPRHSVYNDLEDSSDVVAVDFILTQVCKAWRFAFFKLTGDTLAIFFYHGNYTLGLSDPLRVQLLRSLFLLSRPTLDTYDRVFHQINVTNLQKVFFRDAVSYNQGRARAAIIERIANAFTSAKKHLCLKKFFLETENLNDANVGPSLQALLDSLKEAPIEEFFLQDRTYYLSSRCHLRFNTVHEKLTTIKLSDSFIFDDLAAAAPNLQSFSLLGEGELEEGEVIGLYPMTNVVLPKLRKLWWNGNNWADSLITLPPVTLSAIKEINIFMYNDDTITTSLTKLLPHTRSLESLTLAYYKQHKGAGNGVPDMQTLSNIIRTTSATLRHISLPVSYDNPDALLTMLQNKPSLRKVELFSSRLRIRGLARIRAVTGVDVDVKDLGGFELREVEDEDEQ
ncbi:hypothetical protein HDV00_004346 [Rhizophlyctis rosea]|nr:hypothetical protein HDV00_004346 [Rhizophlyctis rosea]